jgi:hypothetical protein
MDDDMANPVLLAEGPRLAADCGELLRRTVPDDSGVLERARAIVPAGGSSMNIDRMKANPIRVTSTERIFSKVP